MLDNHKKIHNTYRYKARCLDNSFNSLDIQWIENYSQGEAASVTSSQLDIFYPYSCSPPKNLSSDFLLSFVVIKIVMVFLSAMKWKVYLAAVRPTNDAIYPRIRGEEKWLESSKKCLKLLFFNIFSDISNIYQRFLIWDTSNIKYIRYFLKKYLMPLILLKKIQNTSDIFQKIIWCISYIFFFIKYDKHHILFLIVPDVLY